MYKDSSRTCAWIWLNLEHEVFWPFYRALNKYDVKAVWCLTYDVEAVVSQLATCGFVLLLNATLSECLLASFFSL